MLCGNFIVNGIAFMLYFFFHKTKNAGCGSSVSGFLHPNIFVAIRCTDNNASYRLKMHLTAQTLEKDGKSAKIALHSEKDR